MYEISREVFKQRLEKKLNFAFIDVNSEAKQSNLVLEGTEQLSLDSSFVQNLSNKYPDKSKNILVFSLKKSDTTPKQAAEQLAAAGYQFVYYYVGSEQDLVLDKGLN
jgi:hypothetical protein